MNDFTYLKDPDFKEGRRYVGASDIPTLALLNLKYDQSPLTLWEQKTGRADPFMGNERTRAGKEMEPLVLKWGLEKLDYPMASTKEFLKSRILENNKFINIHNLTEARHPDRPYLISHADLIEVDTPIIMEAKTTGYFGAKRADNINLGYDKDDLSANGIPSSVYLQIQTQMLCYGIDTVYVSVMIDTGQHRLYGPISAHKKTQEKILALAERFWYHVENDKAPKPEIWKDVMKLNPILKKDSQTTIGGPDLDKIVEMIEKTKKLRSKQKSIKKEMDDIKNAIGLMIGKSNYLMSARGDKLATAFNVTRYSLKDYKKMNKRRLTRMLNDGFVNKTTYRNLKF